MAEGEDEERRRREAGGGGSVPDAHIDTQTGEKSYFLSSDRTFSRASGECVVVHLIVCLTVS